MKKINQEVRSYRRSLAVKNGIISTKSNYIENLSNILEEGSDKLILADLEQEGAELLSLRLSQQLGVQALQLASNSNRTVLQLFQ